MVTGSPKASHQGCLCAAPVNISSRRYSDRDTRNQEGANGGQADVVSRFVQRCADLALRAGNVHHAEL